MSTLAERIREAREAAELTQTQLAKKVGITQPQVTRLETGRDRETAHLVKIALATRHSAYWLATGRGTKKMGDLEATILELSEAQQRETMAFIEGLRRRG